MKYSGPIVLAILDGVGLAPDAPGNAVSRARTPFLSSVAREYVHEALFASGKAVGLTPGTMGNSEVGHNTMGAGRAITQGVAKINEDFADGAIFESKAWHEAIDFALNGGVLHFAGILSDGGVHSDIAHLLLMIEKAYHEGVRKMRIHAVFDGRDVGPFTAGKYVDGFYKYVARFRDADIKIADGGGRMVYVADRYENDWKVVARGWDAMVNGKADYYFKDAGEALSILRRIDPGCQDQNLPPFVIVDENDAPVGTIKKGDALIYFDFRADRAVEIAEAFTRWDFTHFNRGTYKPSDVYFVGMTEYNTDTHMPVNRLSEPVLFSETLSEVLAERGVSQLAVSETVKFGHVTYYFNGNSYAKHEGEEFVEVESYVEPFETRPWMKSAEIADEVCQKMAGYRFVRVNFPGGDMVGHTADIRATVMAMEAIDLALSRIAAKVDALGGALLIVADHGNAEELLDEFGKKKTAHTLNKVPFIMYDNTKNAELYELNDVAEPGLSNLAATIALMLNVTDYPETWDKALIREV